MKNARRDPADDREADVQRAAADGRPGVRVADDADDPLVDRAEHAARARRASWNHCCVLQVLVHRGKRLLTNATAWRDDERSTSQSMPAITRMNRMITVRIATPRFMPRRWNHRTSGSRPSVMNAAANTEKRTPEMLAKRRDAEREADEHAERRDERPRRAAVRHEVPAARAPAIVDARVRGVLAGAPLDALHGVSLGVRMPRAGEARRTCCRHGRPCVSGVRAWRQRGRAAPRSAGEGRDSTCSHSGIGGPRGRP